MNLTLPYNYQGNFKACLVYYSDFQKECIENEFCCNEFVEAHLLFDTTQEAIKYAFCDFTWFNGKEKYKNELMMLRANDQIIPKYKIINKF